MKERVEMECKGPILVVGGSRGVGAAVVRRLGTAGIQTIATFNKRSEKAHAVASGAGAAVTVFQLDITDAVSLESFVGALSLLQKPLAGLVMCASGGLEPAAPECYAMQVNVDGQLALLEAVLPLMRSNGRVLYLTSHEAHFWGRKESYGPYAKVAASKYHGEQALRDRAMRGLGEGCSFTVVSADLIEDSVTAKLLTLGDPDLIERRRAQAGRLPTSDDVAKAVIEAIIDARAAQVSTTYVWEPDSYYAGAGAHIIPGAGHAPQDHDEMRREAAKLLIGATIGFLDSVGLGVIIPLLPFVVLTMSGSPAVVTQLVAVFALAGFLLSPLLGRVSDRIGRRRVILLTLLGSLISYIGMLLSTSLATLFLFRAFGGAMSGRDAVTQALVTDDITTDRHMRAIGIVTAARGAGLALGPVLGGGLAWVTTGPAAHFKATLIMASLLTIGALAATAGLLSDASSPPKKIERRPSRHLWAKWIGPFALTGAASYGFGVIFSMTALFVFASFQWREAETGLLLGLSAGLVSVSRLVFARRWVARWGAAPVMAGSLTLAMAGLLLMGGWVQPIAFLIGFAALSVAYGVIIVITTVTVTQSAADDERGFALGLNQAVAILSIVVSAAINGIVFSSLSPRAPFFIGAAALAISLFFWRRKLAQPTMPTTSEGEV